MQPHATTCNQNAWKQRFTFWDLDISPGMDRCASLATKFLEPNKSNETKPKGTSSIAVDRFFRQLAKSCDLRHGFATSAAQLACGGGVHGTKGKPNGNQRTRKVLTIERFFGDRGGRACVVGVGVCVC